MTETLALPQLMWDNYKRLGGYFCCPSGHRQGWDEGQAERDKKDLKNQLAQEARKREILETQLRAAENKTGRLLKERKNLQRRVGNGVCPCCHRTFKQLAAHMSRQHPEYSK